MSDNKRGEAISADKHARVNRGGRGGPGFGPPGMGAIEKPKDFKGTLKRLILYLKPQYVRIIFVAVTAILSTVFSIWAPKIMANATTEIYNGMIQKMFGVPNGGVNFTKIGNILVQLLALYLTSSLFSYVQQYLMVDVSQHTVRRMRSDINQKLTRLPLKYYDGRTHGEILSRITNDVENISSSLQQGLTQIITGVMTILGVLIMMLSINWIMTLITLIVLPFTLFISRPLIKRSQTFFKRQQEVLGDLNGHIEEMYTGHKIIKAYGRENKAIEKFDEVNGKLYKVGWKAQFISGLMMPMAFFVNNLAYVGITVVGGMLVANKGLAIGDIQAFITYSRQFSQQVNQIAQIANVLQSTIASGERVFEILDEEEEIPDPMDEKVLSNVRGDVVFQNIKFSYVDEKPLIENLSLDIKSGSTIAIVGPTGAGKTTIVNLLMRFYEIGSGSIMLDGVQTTKMHRNHLRGHMGMVLQDTWLFNGTIRDNIAYGKEGATEDEIIMAAKRAHADHFIRTLQDGYDTILNEEASNISQGQRQLITIARAMLSNPTVLILDEATSNVDTMTEIRIQKGMRKLMEGRTSFVIAHRLSTIRNADLILVMNKGDIIEQGTHSELMAKNGFYTELYNSQFLGNADEAI